MNVTQINTKIAFIIYKLCIVNHIYLLICNLLFD